MTTKTENKVMFGLENVHYAIATVGLTGEVQYGTVKRLPGAVSLTLENEQSSENFYADNSVYHVSLGAAGYKGEIEIANITEDFEKDVLNMKRDGKNVTYEDLGLAPEEVALMFEIKGDKNKVRHVLYRVKFAKPKLEYKTLADKTDVATVKMEFAGLANAKNIGRAKTNKDTDQTTYDNWFSKVYVATAEE